MSTNIQQPDELYQIQSAKVDFQATVSALLEVQSELSNKKAYATQNKKEFISHHVDEAEIICDQLLSIATSLCGAYDVVNATNKHLIFQNRVLKTHIELLKEKTINKAA
jgi:hypothetical protein